MVKRIFIGILLIIVIGVGFTYIKRWDLNREIKGTFLSKDIVFSKLKGSNIKDSKKEKEIKKEDSEKILKILLNAKYYKIDVFSSKDNYYILDGTQKSGVSKFISLEIYKGNSEPNIQLIRDAEDNINYRIDKASYEQITKILDKYLLK